MRNPLISVEEVPICVSVKPKVVSLGCVCVLGWWRCPSLSSEVGGGWVLIKWKSQALSALQSTGQAVGKTRGIA